MRQARKQIADIGPLHAELGLPDLVAVEQHFDRGGGRGTYGPALEGDATRGRQRDLVAMVVKAVARFGRTRPRQIGDFDSRRHLAHDPGAGQGPPGYGLRSGPEPSDIAAQHKAREAGIRIIRPDRLDIVAHPAEFGLADALAIDELLHRLDLDETDDPALDAEDAAPIDSRLVDIQLHRQ